MKADIVSRTYLALEANRAGGKMELNQEIAAALASLPDDPSLYFDHGEAHLLFPLEQLVNVRVLERGIISANRYMLASARGKQEKRKPLTVHALGSRLSLVVDGNSTLLNARHSNWRAVPSTTVDKPTWDPSSA